MEEYTDGIDPITLSYNDLTDYQKEMINEYMKKLYPPLFRESKLKRVLRIDGHTKDST